MALQDIKTRLVKLAVNETKPPICRFGPAIAVDARADNKGRAAVGSLRSKKVLISRDIAFLLYTLLTSALSTF
jgi:hypothetical protein